MTYPVTGGTPDDTPADPSAKSPDASPKLSRAQEETLLEELRERFDYAQDQWAEIRREADKDMRFVAGDPWEANERAAREAAMRPVLSLDELGQYYDQTINDVRANPLAMKFSPTGNGADDAGAKFYEEKARETEYRSHAQIPYTTAFQDCVHRGFGWVRLTTKYESDRSDNQEIWIEEIADPNSVLPDPDAKRPDSSDAKYLFCFETWTRKEFLRKWPTAKITDFAGEVADLAPRWLKGEKVVVAEYWKIKTKKRTLQLFRTPDGQSKKVFEDEFDQLPEGSTRIKELRTVDYPSVCQYLTNGVEILETTEWPGKYLPFASCFGKVLYLNEGSGTTRKIMSMTRLGRDPFMLYCYYRTQQAEMAGMIPKVPVMAYKGQFAGLEHDWQKAPHEPLAFLEINARTEATGSETLPLPQRLAYNAGEQLQALELCAEGARRAIQASMGSSPLPTSAQRRNEKSGIALRQIESTSQKGSFHFKDHYQDMIRHVGVIFEDLCDKIYDTPRETGVRKANDTAEVIRINDPAAVDKTGQPAAVMTTGDYLVTVSTGPAFESQREAASDFADQLVQNPQVFPLIASEVVKLKNLGPIGDEIATALEVLKPPELRKKDGQAPLPPEAQQAMAENQQLKGQLQQAAEAIKTEQAKQQAMVEKAKVEATVRIEQSKQEAQLQIELQKMKGAVAIRVAEINAETKGIVSGHEAQHEAAALAQEQAHEAEQNALDRQHAVGMTALSGEQQAELGEQQHARSLEAGDVSHAQALEQQEQAGAQQQALAEQQAAQQAAVAPEGEV